MTEDSELTAYCYKYDIRMKYISYISFYDEQSTEWKVYHNQHIRWVWGFFFDKNRVLGHGKHHHNTSKMRRFLSLVEFKTSFYPFAVMMSGFTLLVLFSLVMFIISLISGNGYMDDYLYRLIYLALITWGLPTVSALVCVIRETRHGLINPITGTIGVIFYIGIFIDLILAFIDGFFHKELRTTWKQVPHYGHVTNKKARKNI